MHIDSRRHVLALLDKAHKHVHYVAYELVDYGTLSQIPFAFDQDSWLPIPYIVSITNRNGG